jgi:nitrate reductase gamma subunit
MNAILSLIAVLGLILIALIGVQGANLHFLFGIVVPYIAIIIFLFGVISRVMKWGRTPVPFCIPTTCGQQKSLPWIKQSKLDNPSTTSGVVGRMLLEVFLFRSLFSNTKFELREGPKLSYGSTKWLWLGGLAFHWSFLVVLVRHLRLFTEPVPAFLMGVEALDGFLQVGIPGVLISGSSSFISCNLSFPEKGFYSASPLYFSCSRLFPSFPYYEHCYYRNSDEVYSESGFGQHKGIDNRAG